MLTIYGHPMSTCTRKVLTTLAETNTPFEMRTVDFATGEHKKEPHLSRQPFGRVPAIDDDGFQMFESRAICRYLNDKAQGKLLPKDAKARAKVEQWISIETSEYTGHAMKYVYHHIFNTPQEQAVLDAARKALETTTAVMNKALGSSPFIAGEEFTLADICFMPYFDYTAGTPLSDLYGKHENLTAWWKRVSERPSWKKATGKG